MKRKTIKLDEYYRIEADASSWSLIYEQESEELNGKGNPIVSRTQNWHNTLPDALMWYVSETLKSCDSIDAVLEGIKDLETRLTAICEGIKR